MAITIINKQAPNVVADMVRDAIIFYKKQGKVVDTVYLSRMRWSLFKGWLQRQDESVEIRNEVHFRNVKIKKSLFQIDPIKVTFKK